MVRAISCRIDCASVSDPPRPLGNTGSTPPRLLELANAQGRGVRRRAPAAQNQMTGAGADQPVRRFQPQGAKAAGDPVGRGCRDGDGRRSAGAPSAATSHDDLADVPGLSHVAQRICDARQREHGHRQRAQRSVGQRRQDRLVHRRQQSMVGLRQSAQIVEDDSGHPAGLLRRPRPTRCRACRVRESARPAPAYANAGRE